MRIPTASPERLSALLVACTALLSACGSGSSPSPAAPTGPTTLTGVVATGAALVGASVIVVDSDSATTDPAAVTAGAGGSYTIDVSALKAPFIVQATPLVDGASNKLVAVVPSVTANVSNTANVTSLTNAVAGLIAPGGVPQALLDPATLSANATAQKVGDATALLVSTLKTDGVISAALGTNFNPLTTPFTANGTGVDAVLDQLAIEVTAAGVSITNLAAPVSDQGTPAAVLLTAAQVTNPPQTPPTLPPTAAASDIPSAAEIEFYRAKLQACLALPLPDRVTFAANGIDVTAVSPTCTFGDPEFLSSGRNWVEQLGQFSFSKAQFNNAVFGRGAIVLTLAPFNLTDPKEFKHARCNSGPCAVVRYPATYNGGFVDTWDFLFGKVGGQWTLGGNGRPYDVFVQARLNRYIAANTAPNPTDTYFFKDRYESTLRLFFNASGRNGNLVRAVRFKGPGLPAAGVVLHRSSRCGTDDRFPITYQTGALRRPNDNVLVTFNSGGGTEFTLDAANLNGTPLTMPAPVFNATTVANQNFSPTPVANQATLIPAWTRYAAEIFLFSNTTTPDQPDEIVYIRTDSAAADAADGVNRAWPTLASTFVDAYLKPTGAGAGAVTGPLTMDWTAPPGATVLSSYLFAQNFVTQTNVNNVTSLYAKRTRLDFEPTTYGNLSAPSTLFASVVSGASLAPQTANVAPNPNPRCTDNTALVPFVGDVNDYRETGLLVRLPDRQRQNAIWFWDN
ncbi:MAG: hypothetical protein WA210_21070 [Burkholderiaceae bacterium]